MRNGMTVDYDASVGVCYVKLSDSAVHSTFEYSDDILVDLDPYGVAVGIEVLNPDAQFPLTDLCDALHIHSRDEGQLSRLLPSLSHFMRAELTSAPDATLTRERAAALEPAGPRHQ